MNGARASRAWYKRDTDNTTVVNANHTKKERELNLFIEKDSTL